MPKRQYHRTAQRTISPAKCRPLNAVMPRTSRSRPYPARSPAGLQQSLWTGCSAEGCGGPASFMARHDDVLERIDDLGAMTDIIEAVVLQGQAGAPRR